ncbi:hypothetical protein M1563_05265 [Patescibacteria group bacterium]|nr:hypothetical protein [Patescibacteria group bacterium]MCL5409301.1 hypothetical protein [Patescibacteria group bacterium]
MNTDSEQEAKPQPRRYGLELSKLRDFFQKRFPGLLPVNQGSAPVQVETIEVAQDSPTRAEDFKKRNREESLKDWAKWNREWKQEGFDAVETLNNLKSTLIEVAGPTGSGFDLVDTSLLDRKVFVSNIAPGCPIYDGQTGQFAFYLGRVDFEADSTKLPFAYECLGGIFASCLNQETRAETIAERPNVSLNQAVC